MWPFGKKKEKTEKVPAGQQDPQVQEFVQKFLPEEFTVLAVTGYSGASYSKLENSDLLLVGITLTAWMKDGEEEIHRDEIQIMTLADDRLASFLRSHVPANFIIKTQARMAKNGSALQLIGMPEPAFDPDLKAILEEQKKPVTFESEQFGTFTLMRSAGWFDADAQWDGVETRLSFLKEEDREGCLATARALFADQESWQARLMAAAEEQLLPLARQWAEEAGEEEVSAQEFLEMLTPDSIQVWADGSFQFWYGDGGMIWGHGLQISGSLNEGVTQAQADS